MPERQDLQTHDARRKRRLRSALSNGSRTSVRTSAWDMQCLEPPLSPCPQVVCHLSPSLLSSRHLRLCSRGRFGFRVNRIEQSLLCKAGKCGGRSLHFQSQARARVGAASSAFGQVVASPPSDLRDKVSPRSIGKKFRSLRPKALSS